LHERAFVCACTQGDEVDQAINMYKKNKQYDPMIRLVAQHRKENLAQVCMLVRAGTHRLYALGARHPARC